MSVRECQIDVMEMECEFIWPSSMPVMDCCEDSSGTSAEFLEHLSSCSCISVSAAWI
jgi:hypothetical protein